MNESFDVIIIGAGPAGTSSAALLAETGYKVVVLEKEPFPRYRVGESLIPYCWFPLDRLGLTDKLEEAACTINKYSVQFVGTDGGQTTPFYFNQHTDHPCSRTWQVVRSEFDQLMVDNAISKGAEIRMGVSARHLVYDDAKVVGVDATSKNGDMHELRAPITIDASGRDTFSASRRQWRIKDAKLQKIAMWTYYQGAKRDCGIDEGATTVAYLPDKGWFWYIPLPEDIVSVGVVAERDYLYRGPRDPEAIFLREVEQQPWIRSHLAPGERTTPVRVTGDYSYRSRYCAADGLVLCGDAFAFLDPVFSSGVFLALQSGVLVADAVDSALSAGDVSSHHFDQYSREVRKALEAMRRLIYAFYDTAFSFGDFLRGNPDMRGDLTDCLIGNVDKNLEPLFEAMADYASIPQPLEHGGTLTGTVDPANL